MIKKFFQKFGVYLSKQQVRLINLAIFATVIGIIINLSVVGFGVATNQCEITINGVLHTKNLSQNCVNGLYLHSEKINLPMVVGFGIFIGALTLIAIIPLITYSLTYFTKIVFDKKFREDEMQQSVNYLERDEREQFETMRATRRAYMVLNFALIIAWLVNLLFGNFGAAFWLFLIQAIGALAFRRTLAPDKIAKRG